MDTSPLTLTCCLVLDFTSSFASSCFVLYVYNKFSNFLRAGYFWHHLFSIITAGTGTVFTVSLQQRYSNTDTYMVHYRFICKLHGHRMVIKYFVSFIFITCCKRLCKRDRGEKCTRLSAFQRIKDCNSAISGLHLLHHPCGPRNSCKCFPILCMHWVTIQRNVETLGMILPAWGRCPRWPGAGCRCCAPSHTSSGSEGRHTHTAQELPSTSSPTVQNSSWRLN